jgi:hypothetical protein
MTCIEVNAAWLIDAGTRDFALDTLCVAAQHIADAREFRDHALDFI